MGSVQIKDGVTYKISKIYAGFELTISGKLRQRHMLVNLLDLICDEEIPNAQIVIEVPFIFIHFCILIFLKRSVYHFKFLK